MVNYTSNSTTAVISNVIATINDLADPYKPNTWYTTDSSSGKISFEITNKDEVKKKTEKDVRDDTLTTLSDYFDLRYFKDGYQTGATRFLPQVVDVQTYGDKVVKVIFSDGTFTKAVKDDEDDFLTAGIAICYLKKMLAGDDIKYGTNAFNKVISKIIKIMDKNRKAAEKKKKDEAEAKARRLAKEAKKNKKKIKRDKRK